MFLLFLIHLFLSYCDVGVDTNKVSLNEEVAVGIDLGTTFSCVSVYKPSDNTTSFIQFKNNGVTFPSVAYYNTVYGNDKENVVYQTGWDALTHNLSASIPGRYFYGFKRAMGISRIEEIDKANTFKENVTYKVNTKKVDGKIKIVFSVTDENEKEIDTVTPEKLSSIILEDLKAQIEEHYKIGSLVITTPAYFTTFQVEATKASAAQAGFEEPTIYKEPVAAAYAYQLNKFKQKMNKDEYILVFDLGGGTFDVSILETVDDLLMVNKYGGDNYLGGENVNDNMTNYFIEEIKKKTGEDISKNENKKLRLRRFVEDFKIDLCNKGTPDATLKREYNYEGLKSVELEMSMEKFNHLNSRFYARIEEVLEGENYGLFRAKKGKGMDDPFDKSLISKILLVGGSTRIPYVRTLLGKMFDPSKIYSDLDADTIVAEGGCLLAANKARILPENMSLKFLDVVPLPIGICTDEDYFEPILEKDTFIPGIGTKEFTTSHDGQTRVNIKVAQGYRASFKENHFLGNFELAIPSGQPRGGPRISISIRMRADGTIDVTAKDEVHKVDSKIVFDSTVVRLDETKYKQMKDDAEKNAEADRELKEKFNAQRSLEGEVEYIEKRIKQEGVSEDDKINVEAIIQGVRKWMEENKKTASKADLEEKSNSLREAVTAILEKKANMGGTTTSGTTDGSMEEKTTGREEL